MVAQRFSSYGCDEFMLVIREACSSLQKEHDAFRQTWGGRLGAELINYNCLSSFLFDYFLLFAISTSSTINSAYSL
jgi:hypothetical protein